MFLYVCCLTSSGQDADWFFDAGDYRKAALLYEFEAFKKKSSHTTNEALIKKARALKALMKYKQALATLDRVRFIASDSMKWEVGYQKAVLYYLNGNPRESDFEMKKLALLDSSFTSLATLQFLVQVDLNNYKEARIILDQNFDLSSTEVEYILPVKLKPKDPEKAESLSIFPGIGQWYAGYFWKGCLSGVVQTGLGVFSLYSLFEGYFFTGTLSGVAGLYTFNLGGRRYAGQLAEKKNKEIGSDIKTKLFEAVE